MLTEKSRYASLPLLQTGTRIRKASALAALLAGLLARLSLASACAVCITGADGSVAEAYDWSVLFLMATPYLVMGTIAGYLLYLYRRGRTQEAHKSASERGSSSGISVGDAGGLSR